MNIKRRHNSIFLLRRTVRIKTSPRRNKGARLQPSIPALVINQEFPLCTRVFFSTTLGLPRGFISNREVPLNYDDSFSNAEINRSGSRGAALISKFPQRGIIKQIMRALLKNKNKITVLLFLQHAVNNKRTRQLNG